MRRFVTITLSMLLLLGLSATGSLFAQDPKKDEPAKADAAKDDSKKDESKKDESKKDDPKKDESKKDETKKDDTKAATPGEEPLPTIPPEVEAKLEAARRAVAEAIVAAEDAGLVHTSIDPPPILDILITGRATDEFQLKKAIDQKDLVVGVSPEVFGAWFTGQGKMTGIIPEKNVRIIQPSKGLGMFYSQRAEILNKHIDAVRKAKGNTALPAAPTAAPKAEEKKETPKAEEKKETPKAEEKKEADKKTEEKKEADKKTEESPKDETKKDGEKKDEPK
ncbi:MAG TPA: hypothetical protein VGZ22_02550 [Isosphaeraceae bacterium]|nr:hypothetical protein [Isosphaeraceae bacterium]